MENPIKIDDSGVSLFLETSICSYWPFSRSVLVDAYYFHNQTERIFPGLDPEFVKE